MYTDEWKGLDLIKNIESTVKRVYALGIGDLEQHKSKN